MTASAQGVLLAVWIGFAVVALVGIIIVFVWAVRARQFSDQDRARHLPLRSNIPAPGPQAAEDEGTDGKHGRGKDASA